MRIPIAFFSSLLAATASARPPAPPFSPVSTAAPAQVAPIAPARRDGRLTLDEARRFLVELVNRDRARAHLAPVILDGGAATRAGQRHAEEMAAHGYVGHWGLDGSVPELRFTDAGGADFVAENASCIADGKVRPVDDSAGFERAAIERTEASFINERPPADGHRKNILNPAHVRVGIGIAQPNAPGEIDPPCLTEEFVDDYGRYAPLPRNARVRDILHVAGTTRAPAQVVGVGLSRIDAPTPLPVSELLRRSSYPVPAPYQMYWRAGYVTPIPLTVDGNDFRIDVPLDDKGRPGLYMVSVWATLPGSPDPAMISLRTLRVDR